MIARVPPAAQAAIASIHEMAVLGRATAAEELRRLSEIVADGGILRRAHNDACEILWYCDLQPLTAQPQLRLQRLARPLNYSSTILEDPIDIAAHDKTDFSCLACTTYKHHWTTAPLPVDDS